MTLNLVDGSLIKSETMGWQRAHVCGVWVVDVWPGQNGLVLAENQTVVLVGRHGLVSQPSHEGRWPHLAGEPLGRALPSASPAQLSVRLSALSMRWGPGALGALGVLDRRPLCRGVPPCDARSLPGHPQRPNAGAEAAPSLFQAGLSNQPVQLRRGDPCRAALDAPGRWQRVPVGASGCQ